MKSKGLALFVALLLVISSTIPGCQMPLTSTTPTTPTTTVVSLPPGTDLEFLNFYSAMPVLKDPSTPTQPQIYAMTNGQSILPTILKPGTPDDVGRLGGFDYLQYFLLFVFMGFQSHGSPNIKVEQIRQVGDMIYVLTNFDMDGPTYQPTVPSPFRILKVSKENMTQYGQFTLKLLDQTGAERAVTAANITSPPTPVKLKDGGFIIMTGPFTVDPTQPWTLVEKGSTIHHFADGITEVYSANGSLSFKVRESEASLVNTPAGSARVDRIYATGNGSSRTSSGNTSQIFDLTGALLLTIVDDASYSSEADLNSWEDAIPVVGDYDSDGITDLALYLAGSWYIKQSSTGNVVSYWFNERAGAVPAVGDYDGDGIADLSLYFSGTLYVLESSTNSTTSSRFGDWQSGDWLEAVPAVGDYDGDGKADLAMYLNGSWYIQQSSDGQIVTYWFGGWPGAVPVPGDYDGDGKSDLALYFHGEWYVLQSSNQQIMSYWFGG